MGRSGTRYGLARIAGQPAGDGGAVRHAVINAIYREWNDALGSAESLFEGATAWLDDTITVEVDVVDGIAKSFILYTYDSVAWPIDVMSHWLDVAFACGRLGFDEQLRKIGYLLVDDDANVGTMADLLERPRVRFFEHDGKLANVSKDEIYYTLDLSNGSLPDPQTKPLADLDDEGKKAVEGFRAGAPCACPLCKYVKGEFASSMPSAEDRWTIERACEWASNNTVFWAAARDTFAGWVSDHPYESIVHVTRDFRHLRRGVFPGVTHARVHEIVGTERGGRAFFVAVLTVADTASHWFGTHDGAAWEPLHDDALANEAQPGLTHGIVADPRAPSRLFAWRNAGLESTLFGSTDGGLSWKRITTPAGALAGVSCGSGGVVYGIFATTTDEKPRTRTVCACDDPFAGEASWRPLGPLSFRADEVLATRTPEVLLVAGTAFEEEGRTSAALVRSTDGGATWTEVFAGGDTDSHRSALVHPDGRIFWTPSQMGTLSVSSDDGATWTKLFWDYQPQRMIADPTHPGAVLAMTFNRCTRIVPPAP